MKKREYNIKKTEICRACLSEGVILNESKEEIVCNICNGSGLVTVYKDLSIRIVPKTPKPYAKS